ncbi:MAG: hypothetical protein ACJAVV_002911 [Alphaproteobacteria bacterium]|jgi:hypothetical protein
MADMNQYLVIAITLLVGLGLSLLFFGVLITIASAFGNKRTTWGIVSILLLPLTLIYVILYWQETAYPRKYLLPGAAMVIVAVACIVLL